MAPDLSTMSPAAAVLQVISNFWAARALYAAAKLGIADLVKDGPKTIEELASETGTHAPSLHRLMRALASTGWFGQDDSGRFGPTPITAGIQTGAPGTLRNFAMAELGEEHYPAWEDLVFSVKTGEIAFNHVFGMPNWEFWATHPEHAQIFNRGMSEVTAIMEPAIQAVYDFSGFAKIVDIGGGRGTLIASVLRASPKPRGVVLDLPHVIELGRKHIEAQGLKERCELIPGDFFKNVPEGGDAYILKAVLHDWDDDRSIAILKNCHKAMAPHAKVCLIESVIPANNRPFLRTLGDLNMLIMTGGRERTEAEYRALLDAAGFRLNRIVTTSVPLEPAVLEAVRA